MSPEFNFEELKATDRLPSPTGVALAILQLVEREDANIEELASLVQADPALSARLLRFANSPMIAPRRPIVAVKDAVTRIGMRGVRNLVLGLSLVGHYRTGQCDGFDYNRFWAGSLALAVAASNLTAQLRLAAPEESFTVGLLADIGRLALATVWPQQYSHCLLEAQERDLTQLERQYFAIDHATLTGLLLRDWHIPEIFVQALDRCRFPPIEGSDRVAKIARMFALAIRMRNWCLAGAEERSRLQKGITVQVQDDGLSTETEELLSRIEAEWHEWGQLIEIPTHFPKTLANKPQPGGSPPEPSQGKSLPGLKILLVDDDLLLLTRLTKQLKRAGHQVSTCRNGQEALKRILEDPPQLVITDWRMQPMDGLTLCRTLRDSPLGKQIYLIMLTASETEDDLVQAFDAGIDDYVTKPVSLRVLLARIRAAQRIISLTEALDREHLALEQRAKELELANRKLEQLAHTDVLTGLPNRRYAVKRLQQELAESCRNNLPLSVLLLDLDHFKRINDTMGHEAGDRVLAHTAHVMTTTIRSSDTACRFGGEEFLIIAPNTGPEAARQLGERVRHALETHPPPDLRLDRPITASIGIAATRSSNDIRELLKRADEALYTSKANGRNRVTVAQ